MLEDKTFLFWKPTSFKSHETRILNGGILRYCNVDKRAFPSLLKQVIESGTFSRANAVSALETCGIYPLNRAKITADKLSTSTPLVTEMTASSDTVQASTQAVSSTATVNSPRKGIEVALLTHLRQVTPTTMILYISPSQQRHITEVFSCGWIKF